MLLDECYNDFLRCEEYHQYLETGGLPIGRQLYERAKCPCIVSLKWHDCAELKKQHEEGDKTIYVVGEVDRNIDQNLTIVPLRVIISPITSGSDIPRNADRTTLIKCDLKSIEIHQGDNTTRQISYEILTEHLNYMKSLL
jgi:hypothetical protein